ncbi:hypothetical protein ACQ4PT_057332 [Festuca glaucescens]
MAAQSSSRLHRLLTLLDTGSTQATRFAAARQIGEIAKSHPQELNALLKKVSQYLRSKNWDTRVAAAHAIGAIAENVKHMSVKDLFASVEAEKHASGLSDETGDVGSALPPPDTAATSELAFGSFDINRVLEFGSPLLSSGGQEYDVANDNGKNPADRLARQKQNLRRRLGLDVCEQFMDFNDVIKDEDLLAQKNYWGANVQNNGFYLFNSGQNIQHLVASMVPRYPKHSNFRPKRLSARERNMLKRKAKSNAKDHTKDDEIVLKHPASSNGASSDQVGAYNDASDTVEDEDNIEYSDNGRWPFQQFVDQLILDMFDPIWEVRHGTIMALREILTHQGACAGVYFPDLSSPLADLDDKTDSDSLKRPHGIDLNEDIDVEQLEPVLKRHKKDEPNSSEIMHEPDVESTEEEKSNPSEIMDVDLDKKLVNADDSKAETGLSNVLTISSVEPNSADVKVEPELQLDNSTGLSKADTSGTSLHNALNLASTPSSVIHVPENLKYVKLMKLAKYSCMKNWEFLQDCAIRFLCVLSLDRFGDYVSDQVVAPVRETCAQALGAVLKYMHPSLVCHTLNILLQMQRRQEWEVRHGSLLGIKYLVAVRKEMLKDLFEYVLHACKAGLEDPDDDVRAVAAEALIPAAASLVRLNDQMLHSVVMLLWDILLDLDDLSPSTSSVMNLLAEIYSQPEMVPKMLGMVALGDIEFDLNKATQTAEQEDMLAYSENPYVLAHTDTPFVAFYETQYYFSRRSAIRTLVVRSVTPHLPEPLRPQLLRLLPCILGCVRHPHVAVRQGAGMLLSLLVQGLAVELVPYAPFLVVPLLRCMSDPDGSVRQSVTHSFAALVPLLPLAKGVPLPSGLSERLSRSTEDAEFLEQLLDNSQIDDYKLNIHLSVELRRYQQEGINWLAFLRRFKLHGILCDDMGLGKTLQASAIVASDIAESRARNDDKDPKSLIICPSTLVAHWEYEMEKYIDSSIMKPLQYVGSSPDRILLRSEFDKYNVIITSYDIIRKDIDFLENILWNYCVLDEGHIIKNSRSKITSAVKQLKAQHRLILSGTPIQNNVLELWSLFDFLMPGFLGTEKQFQATYGKPLIAAKDSKCSAKDSEAGILAMEALHKQVMPFLLRRTKDEVLSDLPEKIIQDRYCNLSQLQLKLYDKFSNSNAKEEISTIVKANESEQSTAQPKATRHVFQALQYLLKLCSHPILVTGESPPDYLVDHLREIGVGTGGELHELHHSPKLVALQEILYECGIGSEISSPNSSAAVGQHRVLIFAQHKAFLDIIEKDLFQSHMRSVTYLRLDGSVQTEKRFEIVKSFNSDPTIDVLLLTTHVGGLGLNLTSADTLVFMEHDWNPMKDLQAMDRAHRLGQKKVVNVHRLIMRGTLEEKVMSLQRFKVSVANAVINAENASLKTMNTDQLLDLFTSTPASRKASVLPSSLSGEESKDSNGKPGKKGLKSILNGLDELWDQSQYADEYDMNQFLAKLNG